MDAAGGRCNTCTRLRSKPFQGSRGWGAAASGLPGSGRRRACFASAARSIAASIRPRDTGRLHSMPLLVLPGGHPTGAPEDIRDRNPEQEPTSTSTSARTPRQIAALLGRHSHGPDGQTAKSAAIRMNPRKHAGTVDHSGHVTAAFGALARQQQVATLDRSAEVDDRRSVTALPAPDVGSQALAHGGWDRFPALAGGLGEVGERLNVCRGLHRFRHPVPCHRPGFCHCRLCLWVGCFSVHCITLRRWRKTAAKDRDGRYQMFPTRTSGSSRRGSASAHVGGTSR